MTKAMKWPKSLLFIQSNLNNIKSNFINKTPNKIIYEFSLNIIFTLNIAAESILPLSVSQIEVADVVDFAKIRLGAWVAYRSCGSGLSPGIGLGQANFYPAELGAG